MSQDEARQKLLEEVQKLLPEIEVRDGQYDMIFTDGYMMIWKYVRDYAKAVGANPRKIKRGGVQDPIFTHMNNFMYPPKGMSRPTVKKTAELITESAVEQVDRAIELERRIQQ